jgi:acylphosphatase
MDALYAITFEITGKKIQKAGFRSAVQDIAVDLEITGYAKNKSRKDESGLLRYSVEVKAEGTRHKLKKFIEGINTINTFHVVNPLNANELLEKAKKNETGKRENPAFSIDRDGDHVGERMDEAAYYMKSLSQDMKGMSGDMKVMSGDMKEMRKEVHGDIQTMSGEMTQMREETHENFQTMEKKYHNISNKLNLFVEIIAEYVKSTKPELKDTINGLREQYKE